MTTHILSGKKQICNFLGRGWPTVERWIIEKGFPARKIDGIWESDAELISEWRRNQVISQAKPENALNSDRKGLKKPRRLIRA